MHLGERLHRFKVDGRGVESPIEDLFALMIVVVIIILFVSSLSGIYGMKADQNRRSDLWDRCLSFSTTILNHPMLLEDSFHEEGLFSGFKLQVLKSSYEKGQGQSSGGAGGASAGGGKKDPFTELLKSVHSGEEFNWELYFQDLSGYQSQTAFTFSLRSNETMTIEVQSLVWTVNIFIDVDEIHAARLTILIWEV